MIRPLRSSRFILGDRARPAASVVLELRRHQDLDAEVRGFETLRFLVTKRSTMPPYFITTKVLGTKREARRYWEEQAHILEDQGMARLDVPIVGWHEED